MKRLIFNKGIIVLVLVTAAFALENLLTSGNGCVGGFIEGYIFLPVQRLIASGAQAAENAAAPEKSREELEAENSLLRDENRRLYDMLADYYDIKAENEELMRFYDIKKQLNRNRLVIGAVISRDPGEYFGGFTLDRGSDDGIGVNDAVVTENGLVGTVSAVSPRSCIVRTLLSPELSIGAAVKRTGDAGIICGSTLYSGSGLTRLINLPADNKLKAGDIAVTSAYGGILPEDIKIGTVADVLRDEYTGLPYALIRPFEAATEVRSAAVVIGTDSG